MAKKKKAIPFEGKETPEEERLEHKVLKRKGKRRAVRSKRK
jgi:hypothetical protein